MTADNRLQSALEAVIADPTAQAVFEHALLAETVYVSPSDGVPPLGQVLGVDRPFVLQGATLEDGRKATALFTSPDRLKAAMGPDAPVMGMRGLHALELLKTEDVALNPGAPPGLLLGPDEIEAILVDVRDARPGLRADDVTLAAPEREPVVLIGRLRQALDLPQVTGAWLARAVWADGRADGWYLDVRGATGLAEIRRRVTTAIIGLDFHGDTMDLSVAPEQDAEGVGIKLI